MPEADQQPARMAAARIARARKGTARLLRHRPSADAVRADSGKIRRCTTPPSWPNCPTAAMTRIGGLIAAVQNGISKKSGKPYSMVTLEDLEGSVQVLCMNENYDKFRELLEAEQGHSRHRRSQYRRGQAEDFPAGNHAAGGRAAEIHQAGPFAPAHGASEAGGPGLRARTGRGASGQVPAVPVLSCGPAARSFSSRPTNSSPSRRRCELQQEADDALRRGNLLREGGHEPARARTKTMGEAGGREWRGRVMSEAGDRGSKCDQEGITLSSSTPRPA